MIRLSKSCLSGREKEAVAGVLEHEYLGMGQDVQRFEAALTQYLGRPVVCVGSGTAAVQLAVQAVGLGPEDEVLVPSLTYVASFQAVRAAGARPVACDVDPQTLVLDWRDAERRLTPSTKAVMPVHYSGGVGDLDGIYDFARRHGLRVIEDAAHAFGTTHHDRRVGAFGDVVCFSFDGIKNITCGEGGCVVTDDRVVLERVRDARLLGVEKDTDRRFAGERSWDFDVTAQGWRYHMSNLMAAIGLAQLERFPVMAAARQRLAKRYDAALRGVPAIAPLPRDYDTVVPHIYVVRIRGLTDRRQLMERLLARGVQTGIHYQPNHWLSFFRDDRALPCPVVDATYPELLTLPLHPDLTDADVDQVCDVLLHEIARA
jgi:dTDP-4-amino-4,6-dideoxygalactose transaminase